ncbi:HAD family hydrolase [Mucilaginibacter sp.]|uniref:HAD family hydrolase n=1 Tax=Mucilaginibacter sp. TaxID=1882438 RepID=UPI003B003C7A
MIKKALIFDLDDTIYPIKPYADAMFGPLYDLIRPHISEEILEAVKEDLLTTPFQKVADRYHFSYGLKQEGMQISLDMGFDGELTPFEDYLPLRDLKIEKFLVTGGYTKFQKSKIKQLGVGRDFKEIFIPDPAKSNLEKADVFKQILNKYHYGPKDVLVIGDNPEAEIAAAKELDIETYLYDYQQKYSPALADYYGVNYKNLPPILS